MYIDKIRAELIQSANVLDKFMNDESNLHSIESAALIIAAAFKFGNKIFACGNGGSHCDAMHFAEELTGRYRENRVAFPAIAISDVSHISFVSNDYGYDDIFSRYLEGLAKKGDILFCLSGSGNSKNIIQAMRTVKKLGLTVIALTSNHGGLMASLSDFEIRVPHHGFADRIQEIHIKIIHILIMLIEIEMQKIMLNN